MPTSGEGRALGQGGVEGGSGSCSEDQGHSSWLSPKALGSGQWQGPKSWRYIVPAGDAQCSSGTLVPRGSRKRGDTGLPGHPQPLSVPAE